MSKLDEMRQAVQEAGNILRVADDVADDLSNLDKLIQEIEQESKE